MPGRDWKRSVDYCASSLRLTFELSARIDCVVQIDPTFELEGLPVGENWRGAGESF